MRRIRPKTRQELEQIIRETIEREDPYCDLNFINTSGIKDMSNLFLRSVFDGDISIWNVSSLRKAHRYCTFDDSQLKKEDRIPTWYTER